MKTFEETRIAYIREVVREAGGNLAEAARISGLSRRTLYNWLDVAARPGQRPGPAPMPELAAAAELAELREAAREAIGLLRGGLREEALAVLVDAVWAPRAPSESERLPLYQGPDRALGPDQDRAPGPDQPAVYPGPDRPGAVLSLVPPVKRGRGRPRKIEASGA